MWLKIVTTIPCVFFSLSGALAQYATDTYIDTTSIITKSVIPISSYELSSKIDDDLYKISTAIGTARVVALGEVTHGSHEIFKFRSRLIKFLIEHSHFNVFIIEASESDACSINNYINSGDGNPVQLIKAMQYWTWSTTEMLELVMWMRNYNSIHKDKIRFRGADIQTYDGSFNVIETIYKHNHNDVTIFDSLSFYLKKLDSCKLLTISQSKKLDIRAVFDYPDLHHNIFSLIEKIKCLTQVNSLDSNEKYLFILYMRLFEEYVSNYSSYHSRSFRDSCMAENVLWFYSQNAEAKYLIWSHNAHIQQTQRPWTFPMGIYLRRSLKTNYYPIGFTFLGTTDNKGGIGIDRAPTAFKGTYEYIFEKAKLNIFFMDLKKLRSNPAFDKLLHPNLLFRITGAGPYGDDFQNQDLLNNFAGLVFIKFSSPTSRLK